MAQNSKIEWTDATWNPVTGCTPISTGCQNCYAKSLAMRFPKIHCDCKELYCDPRAAFTSHPFGAVHTHRERIDIPRHWNKPRRIFVCSMGDLFHDDVPFNFIHCVWDVMKGCPQHIFMVLTKRPERMKECVERIYSLQRLGWAKGFWEHVWLGVTAENQEQYEKRWSILRTLPAAKRFISVEPLLSDIDMRPLWRNDIVPDWVICGGENGSKARPLHPDWVRSLRDQCQHAAVPFFFKGWGQCAYISVDRKIGDDGKVRLDGNRYPALRIDAAGRDVMGIAAMENDETDTLAVRCGKKVSGRLLDGREWNEHPKQD